MSNCTCVEELPMFQRVLYASYAAYVLVALVVSTGWFTCYVLPAWYRHHKHKVYLQEKAYRVATQRIEKKQTEHMFDELLD
jgi:hypothetical protein